MHSPLYVRFCFSFIVATTLTACDPCENRILQEEPAPGGANKAVVFHRQCGVLGGTSTQVSVLPASGHPFAGGNIFGADANTDPSLETPGGGPQIAIKWLGEHELEISYDARMQVFQSEKKLGDVAISYNTQRAPEAAPTDSTPRRRKK